MKHFNLGISAVLLAQTPELAKLAYIHSDDWLLQTALAAWFFLTLLNLKKWWNA